MMKSPEQWFKEYLPEPYRSLAIKRIDKEYVDYRDECDNPNEALTCSFVWSNTPEGSSFWDCVAGTLPERVNLPRVPKKSLEDLYPDFTLNVDQILENRYGNRGLKEMNDMTDKAERTESNMWKRTDEMMTFDRDIDNINKSNLEFQKEMWINAFEYYTKLRIKNTDYIDPALLKKVAKYVVELFDV